MEQTIANKLNGESTGQGQASYFFPASHGLLKKKVCVIILFFFLPTQNQI